MARENLVAYLHFKGFAPEVVVERLADYDQCLQVVHALRGESMAPPLFVKPQEEILRERQELQRLRQRLRDTEKRIAELSQVAEKLAERIEELKPKRAARERRATVDPNVIRSLLVMSPENRSKRISKIAKAEGIAARTFYNRLAKITEWQYRKRESPATEIGRTQSLPSMVGSGSV